MLNTAQETPRARPVSLAGSPERLAALASVSRGRPWDTLSSGLAWLATEPLDHEIRLQVGLAAARLRLVALALETLRELPDQTLAHPEVSCLLDGLTALPSDLIAPEQLVARARSAVASLAERSVDLRTPLDQWEQRVRTRRAHRSADGNVVWKDTSREGPSSWSAIGDSRAAANAVNIASFDAGGAPDPSKPLRPIIIEGINPPWLLERAFRATPRSPQGYQPALIVVQDDPFEALDGLSISELGPELSEQRVTWHIGAEAGRDLQTALLGRLDLMLPGEYRVSPSLGSFVSPTVVETLKQAGTAQVAEHHELGRRIASAYAGRDRAWWARRYAEAASGAGEALRVLIPTTRYSTFIQHSAHDLAEGLRTAGHEARVVIEPNDSSMLSSLTHLRQFERWRPDLVVLINYHRAALPAGCPANVPVVCWIQDRMTHLFSVQAGASLGELDFVVGHVHRELFESFGYPTSRAWFLPVLASGKKFHDQTPASTKPVTARPRFDCEIAYVSHQSETPEQLRDAFCAQAGGPSRDLTVSLIRDVYEGMLAIASGGVEVESYALIERLAHDILRNRLGREPDPQNIQAVCSTLAYPIGERVMRHQTLAWADELCRERGWRLRIYGRGWERHPTLARFARGELPHGEDLRRCYHHAALHLHAGFSGMHHQRVIECALSGGCAIFRLKHIDLWVLQRWAQNSAAQRIRSGLAEPAAAPDPDMVEAALADHPEAMLLRSLLDRCGVSLPAIVRDTLLVPRKDLERPWADRAGTPQDFVSAWLIGDPVENGFWSRESFRRAAIQIIESPERRRASTRWQREAAKGFTYERVADELIGFLRQRLAATP